MSFFLASTPILKLSLRNHFAGVTYPSKGHLQAIVDTGYDGFLALPESVFLSLELHSAPRSMRSVYTADARRIELTSSPVSAEIEGVPGEWDGMAETGPGIREVLLGARFLSRFKLTLNYCTGILRTEPCS